MSNEDKQLIISTDDLYTYVKEVEEGGKYKANIYSCSSGVPTIGVGFALLIEDSQTNIWSIKENLFSNNGIFEKAEVALPNEGDIRKIKNVLDNVIRELNNDDKDAAKKLVKDNATILNKLTITENQAKELFKITQAEYENYLINRILLKAKVSKDKAKQIIRSLSTDEQIVIFSSVYNAITLIGAGLSNALKSYTKDGVSEKDKAYYKTEAWYEIRYNSHKTGWKYINKEENEKGEGDDGLANRRYKDSLKFGLYGLCNGKQKKLSQDIKDGILKFLNSNNGRDNEKVTETIKKYEKEFSPSNNDLGSKKQNDIEKILETLEEINDDPVEQIKAEAKERGRKIDNVTEAFLKKYDKKYGLVLDKERPIYNSITKIEEHTDLLIFPLMDRLVVSMEKEEKKATGDKKIAIRKFINRCKETLEEVVNDLGGYKRTAYKQDNSQDLTDLERKKRLIAAFKRKRFNSPDTKKSHEFFKSFITKEDEEKERARKEAEEKKKREEERKKRAKAKAVKRKREAKEVARRRKEEKEKARKREGWIVVQKLDGTESMSRKEYYGV